MRVTVTCQGRGCPERWSTTVRRAGKLDFARRFSGRPLRPGTRIVVRVAQPGFADLVARFLIRRGRAPSRS